MFRSGDVYRFGEFDLEPGIVQLRRDGSPVHLEPKTFDLLLYLIAHRERFVGKDELLEAVWDGAFVTESALTRAVTRLRQVLGDRARAPRFIETRRGRGYRFCAAVETVPHASTQDAASTDRAEPRTAKYPIGAGPHNIPSPTPDFTGRKDELEALLDATNTKSGALIAGLRGMGGMGKTELARCVAQERWDAFPDAHLEIDLLGASPEPLSCAAALTQLLHDLNPQAVLPDDESALRRIYQGNLRGKRGIVLLDNAATSDQVEPLLPPEGWLTFVTSRFRFAVPGLDAFDLGPLRDDEARAFLAKISPRCVHVTNDLLRLTGQLPLALRLVGGALASHSDLEPSAYLRRFEKAESLDHRLETSLAMSFELLDETQQTHWIMLSIFPNSFTAAAVAAIWETDEETAQGALSDLFVASMVESTAGRYRLHDVARRFARSRLSDPDPPSLRHAAHCFGELVRLEDRYVEGGNGLLEALAEFDRDWPNIEAAFDWLAANDRGESAEELLAGYPVACRRLLMIRLHPRHAIRWQTQALKAAKSLRLRKLEAELHGAIGASHLSIGAARQAIVHTEQQMVIAREIGDIKNAATSLANLGEAHISLGDARQAIVRFEQASAIVRDIGDRRLEGQVLGCLGSGHSNLGHIPQALEYLERALGIARETGDIRNEGIVLRNLGVSHWKRGDARQAVAHVEQALEIAREMGDRRRKGWALTVLGCGYTNLGNTHQAVEYLEHALVIARETGDTRSEGQALIELGRGHADLGDARQAVECHEKALSITRQLGDRAGEGETLKNLGIVYAALGDVQRAVGSYEEALIIAREIGDQWAESQASWHLSLTLEEQGDLPRALELAQFCVKYEREIGHLDTETHAERLESMRAGLASDDSAR